MHAWLKIDSNRIITYISAKHYLTNVVVSMMDLLGYTSNLLSKLFFMLSRKSFLQSTGLAAGAALVPGFSLALTPGSIAAGRPILTKPERSNSYWYIGHLLSVLLDSVDTGGQFSLLKMTEPKGLEPPPHIHTREDEIFTLLEGEMMFTCGGETFHAKTGDTMFLPKNILHSFQVVTEKAEVLIALTPGGLEKFFIEMSMKAPEMRAPPMPSGPPDIQRLITTAGRYGVKFPKRP
ncbi:MAG: cupin protein [Chitinophagaceae bacterium]|nr:cupin protein [Chitinophagaceae bacterium]